MNVRFLYYHKFQDNLIPALFFCLAPTYCFSLLSKGTSAPRATVSWLFTFLSRNKVSKKESLNLALILFLKLCWYSTSPVIDWKFLFSGLTATLINFVLLLIHKVLWLLFWIVLSKKWLRNNHEGCYNLEWACPNVEFLWGIRWHFLFRSLKLNLSWEEIC